MEKCLASINGSVQTVIIPEIRRSMKNKDLFIHNVMEEVTGLLLVTVHSCIQTGNYFSLFVDFLFYSHKRMLYIDRGQFYICSRKHYFMHLLWFLRAHLDCLGSKKC